MSGHSRWAKIKRAKGATDAKRGALFTKIARAITVAAQEGGGDLDMNFTLRLAVDKAKAANMPIDNIERSIKKGTGELQAESVSKMTYEAIVAGVGILIDCATDNSNRTVSEVRNIVEKAGEKLAGAGSVSWQFNEEGKLELGVAQLRKSEKYGEKDSYTPASQDDLEAELMELEGIIDYTPYVLTSDEISEEETQQGYLPGNFITVRVEKTKLKQIADALTNAGWQVLDAQIVKHPANTVKLEAAYEEKLANLIANLEDYDDVDNVWTNAA